MAESTLREREVRELVERWADAVCRGDIGAVMASHAPDIVMYDVPEPLQAIGLEAYRQTWELFFAENRAGPDRFRLSGLKVVAGDDVAVAHGLLSISGGSVQCRLTIALQRTAQGWQVFHEHHSMPIAL